MAVSTMGVGPAGLALACGDPATTDWGEKMFGDHSDVSQIFPNCDGRALQEKVFDAYCAFSALFVMAFDCHMVWLLWVG